MKLTMRLNLLLKKKIFVILRKSIILFNLLLYSYIKTSVTLLIINLITKKKKNKTFFHILSYFILTEISKIYLYILNIFYKFIIKILYTYTINILYLYFQLKKNIFFFTIKFLPKFLFHSLAKLVQN